jgi:hypothetical protein
MAQQGKDDGSQSHSAKGVHGHNNPQLKHCWCNYMHNILPNINYRPGFVISRVDTLYVPTIDRFLCLMSLAQSRNNQ